MLTLEVNQCPIQSKVTDHLGIYKVIRQDYDCRGLHAFTPVQSVYSEEESKNPSVLTFDWVGAMNPHPIMAQSKAVRPEAS